MEPELLEELLLEDELLDELDELELELLEEDEDEEAPVYSSAPIS